MTLLRGLDTLAGGKKDRGNGWEKRERGGGIEHGRRSKSAK